MPLRLLRLLVSVSIVCVAAAVLVAGGSSGGSSGGSAAASPTPSQGAAGSSAGGRAVWASQALVDAVVKGQNEGVDMQPVRAVVVKSEDGKSVYYVAVQFTAPGESGPRVGVWATQDPEGTSLIWAVDDVAKQATQWPFTSAADKQQYTMSGDGAQEAADALK